jgi:caspase domain-containing protein
MISGTAMELVFRATTPRDDAAAPGEIYILPRGSDAQRRDLAVFVVDRGIAALLQGTGPITRIVIPCDTTRPTLDDMMAAAFVRRLIEGTELPAGAAVFAKYAALAREGLQPGDMPLESSMEGIFLSIRNNATGDLSNPTAAASFLGDWQRMEQTILKAADAGKDPFVTNLFGDSAQFARERTFLKKDENVYREDVRRGQQWIVQIPGGPPSSAMLVLDQPKSLLWKYWSRRDNSAPVGGSYLLLVVNWGKGHWVISTDPIQRIGIKELADKLQEAEAAKGAAVEDPWFDGAPFGHTLVAAPKSGTQLDDRDVQAIIKKWSKAKPVTDVRKYVAKHIGKIVGGAGVTVFVSVLASILASRFNNPPPITSRSGNELPASTRSDDKEPVDFEARGSVLPDQAIQDLKSEGIHVPGYAVIVGVGEPQGDFPELKNSCRTARQFYVLLRDVYGFSPANMRLLCDKPKDPDDSEDPDIPADAMPTKMMVEKAINDVGGQTARYADGNRTNFIFFYGGHGDPREVAGQPKIGYLVLSGYNPTDADDTGFDMSYLVSFVSHRVVSSHQIMLVDCCYSGFITTARGPYKTNVSDIYSMWKQKARIVITAGTAKQESWDAGRKPLFTGNLLQALTPDSTGRMPADFNGDGIVTDDELFKYLHEVVSQEAHDLPIPGYHELTPQYLRALPDSDDDVGQFLFIPANLTAGNH